jgi:CcmD family protein
VRRLGILAVVLAMALSAPLPALADRDRENPEHVRPEEDRGTSFERVVGTPHENVPGGRLLLIAYGAVWMAVFGYVVIQWRRQSRVQADLSRMERALERERDEG